MAALYYKSYIKLILYKYTFIIDSKDEYLNLVVPLKP